MTLDRSLTLACVAVFAIPIGGVLAARFIGVAVNTTQASALPAEPGPITPLPEPQPRLDRTPALSALQSPFRSMNEAVVREIPSPMAMPDPGDSSPVFNLTAVMPHAQRPIAVINGRPRTIGEELAPGWKLAAIDGESRTIVIEGPEGDRVRVRMGAQGGISPRGG